MPDRFANTPEPPYFAAIFTSQYRGKDDEEYRATAEALASRVLQQPGCLGIEVAGGTDGFAILVAYFSDEAAIRAWKGDAEHLKAQRRGIATWYSHYKVRFARVERSYAGPEGRLGFPLPG